MLKNNKHSYGWLSISLHWLSAIIVIGMFILGVWMVGLDYYSVWYKDAPYYHKSIGLILTVIILLRIFSRIRQVSPAPVGSKAEQQIARLTHVLLYLGMLSLFLTGYLISTADGRGIEVFHWFTVPSSGKWFDNQEDISGEIHQWLAYLLMALVTLHAAAALKHHFINKDGSLNRMIKPQTTLKDK